METAKTNDDQGVLPTIGDSGTGTRATESNHAKIIGSCLYLAIRRSCNSLSRDGALRRQKDGKIHLGTSIASPRSGY